MSLRTHSQNMTIAARAQADRKISACRSKRMATLRESALGSKTPLQAMKD